MVVVEEDVEEEEEEVTESNERASKRRHHRSFVGMNSFPCCCVSIWLQWTKKGGMASHNNDVYWYTNRVSSTASTH